MIISEIEGAPNDFVFCQQTLLNLLAKGTSQAFLSATIW